ALAARPAGVGVHEAHSAGALSSHELDAGNQAHTGKAAVGTPPETQQGGYYDFHLEDQRRLWQSGPGRPQVRSHVKAKGWVLVRKLSLAW
ncbi:MAG: hypothetical protein ACK56I_01390, partial [bacterium]